jgi:DNA-binding NarL/FixJ family response regulator
MLRNIPLVVYTTSSDELDARRCLELGADSYVTKPDSFTAMVKVFKSTAEQRLEHPEPLCYDSIVQPGDTVAELPASEVLEIGKKRDQDPPR